MITSWQQAVAYCAQAGAPCVLITILATSGSTPRATGSKMVITATTDYDTIGGGQLEQLVIERARQLLLGQQDTCEITHFPLSAAAQQCCGGSVTVLFEAIGLRARRLCIFGAGNVGRRVAMLMQEVDCAVTLVDSRPDQLARAPSDVTLVQLADPVDHVVSLCDGSDVLVMTHDHQLDYRLVKALLDRGGLAVGLIGSATKWCRFRARLLTDGMTSDQLDTVRCPVGRREIPSKRPMAVAVSIAAELLAEQRETVPAATTLSWRQIRTSLVQTSRSDEIGDSRLQFAQASS